MSMSLYIFSDFTKPRATAYGELGGALNPLEACGMSKAPWSVLRPNRAVLVSG